MRVARHILVALVTAALIASAIPLGLALGCVPRAGSAAAPCDRGDCEGQRAPEQGCICIHYPAPHAPGSLAVMGAPPPMIAVAAMTPAAPAPPAAVAARGDPPEPPPPR